jgi:hypothetical protein
MRIVTILVLLAVSAISGFAQLTPEQKTTDFLALVGSATGGLPGRVAEFDGQLHFVANHFGRMTLFQVWPSAPPLDDFNPHVISIRPDLNLMMTADFILPSSTLNGSAGPVLRSSIRIWDYKARQIIQTVQLVTPDGGPALGTMDVRMLPNDPNVVHPVVYTIWRERGIDSALAARAPERHEIQRGPVVCGVARLLT